MENPIRFCFIKEYEKPFENLLDIIREALNDVGSKEFALKAFEVTAEAGDNDILRELTKEAAGKLRGINLGLNYETLAPPAAPRPEIAQVIQFRDFISPTKPMKNFLPPESLMEFTAQLSHKVGEILLINAGFEHADGYIAFKEGRIDSYGFSYSDEFVIRYHRGEYVIDVYKTGEQFEDETDISKERIAEAIKKANLDPCTFNTHEDEMVLDFWKVSKEGFNLFYNTKLKSLGTTQSNFTNLHQVSGTGIGHYDIYPEGVSYAYPAEPKEPEEKKPWWKVW